MNIFRVTIMIAICLAWSNGSFSQKSNLETQWGQEVSPENVWKEYPRPQLVRDDWQTLNGLWEYSILNKSQPNPKSFQGRILVPFAVESALSGVQKSVGTEDRVWYKRNFEVPSDWKNKSVILNFDAVDYSSSVWVNGAWVGSHKGGFDRFSFDITPYLKKKGKQELVVGVDDPSSFGTQPRGKQQIPQQRIWYTPVSGIWQSVWLEAVSSVAFLKEVKIETDIDKKEVTLIGFANKPLLPEYQLEIKVLDQDKVISGGSVSTSKQLSFSIPDMKLWSPETPFLYDLEITLKDPSGNKLDEVSSYFGMRKISLDLYKGDYYLFLNNQPLFQYGTLDQGWWPDGLHTPPSDEAMKYDIEVTKKMGFNMIRKHIKVEPDRWYYHCDKLGMLVWQDMPSAMAVLPKGGNVKPHHLQHTWRHDEDDLNKSGDDAAQFEWELSRMINLHYNFPSIVMWVPFNEGMGQYSTCRISGMVKAMDPTRLVNAISGWLLQPCGDVYDIHTYQVEMDEPVPPLDRASVVGEFGGVGYPVKGHLWNPNMENWGYQTYQSQEDLVKNYKYKLDQVVEMKNRKGLSAAVYTQITDVEGEVNGLITYDRKVIKIPVEILREMHAMLYK